MVSAPSLNTSIGEVGKQKIVVEINPTRKNQLPIICTYSSTCEHVLRWGNLKPTSFDRTKRIDLELGIKIRAPEVLIKARMQDWYTEIT
ncbi:MAG: hypothetical protein AAGA66_11025, partial [Bacteroidota bacterium]